MLQDLSQPSGSQGDAPNSRGSSWLVSLAKYVFAAGIFAYLIFGGRLELWRLVDISSPIALFLCWISMAGLFLFMALRWFIILYFARLYVPLNHVILIQASAHLGNLILPAGLGSDGLKFLYVQPRYPSRKSAIILTLVLDRILGAMGLILLLLVVNARECFWIFQKYWGWILLGFLAAVISVWLMCQWSLGRHCKWTRLGEFMKDKLRRLPILLIAFAMAIGGHLAFCLAGYFALDAMGAEVTVLEVMRTFPWVILVSTIPISPLGLGTTDLAGETLFAQLGQSLGAEMVMLLRITAFMIALVATCILWLEKSHFFGGIGQAKRRACE